MRWLGSKGRSRPVGTPGPEIQVEVYGGFDRGM
jgi:hypothetical protein